MRATIHLDEDGDLESLVVSDVEEGAEIVLTAEDVDELHRLLGKVLEKHGTEA